MGAVTAAAMQAKKAQILKGALRVFLQEGYEGTSMDQVALKAGVSKITIYKHFLDKKSLFTILIKSVIAERFSPVFGALPVPEPPATVLRQLAMEVLALFSDDESVEFYRLIVGESRRFPELAQLFLRSVSQQVWSVLSVYLEVCPDVQCEHPAAISRIFVGSLTNHVLTQQLLSDDETIPMEDSVLIDTLIALVIS